jgi:hypothetical protein
VGICQLFNNSVARVLAGFHGLLLYLMDDNAD